MTAFLLASPFTRAFHFNTHLHDLGKTEPFGCKYTLVRLVKI